MNYKELNDQELARLCSERDRQAQEELYTRYAARLFTLCRRYSDNRSEAQDMVHDTFLKVIDKISTYNYQGEGSLYAWINRIAINTALANIKRHKSRFIRLSAPISGSLEEPSDEDISIIPEDVLLDLISMLPDIQRAVFNMYCLDGYSHKDIAEKLGISERGSTSTLAKARLKIRKSIKEYMKHLN